MKTTIKKSFLASATAVALIVPGFLKAETVLWESLFNTVNQTGADDGGVIGGFFGGGDPFFQADPAVVVGTDNAGEGPDGSNCMSAEATFDLTTTPDFAFFGTFIQHADGSLGTNTMLDITNATLLRLDAKLGTSGAHAEFAVKLEDNGFEPFNALAIALDPDPNETTWTTYEIPVADFLDTTGRVVDLENFNQITIEARNPPLGTNPVIFHLLIDNIQIVEEASNVSDWELF